MKFMCFLKTHVFLEVLKIMVQLGRDQYLAIMLLKVVPYLVGKGTTLFA